MVNNYPKPFLRHFHLGQLLKSFIPALSLMLACQGTAFGQASTDPCGFTPGAQYLVNATCVPVAFNKPATFVNNMIPAGCGSGNYGDAFGWFTGTGNPVIVKYTPPAGSDAVLHVLSGTCAAPTVLGCSDACCGGAVETVTIATTLGTQYIVRVQKWGSSTVMNGTLCVYSAPPPPANDDPCGAVNLPVNANCVNTASTTASTTGTTGVPAPTCANYSGSDVWFKITVPAGGAFTVTSSAGVVTDGGMALYTATACNGTFTQISCNDDANGLMPAITTSGLVPGSIVYVRFWEYGNDNNGTFAICATLPPPPIGNDNPCSAAPLTVNPNLLCGTQTSGSLVGATATTGVPTTPCYGTPNDDVWFRFTASATTHTIALNNITGNYTDLYMAVYSGTCTGLTNIACSDPETMMISGLTIGSTYWVRVYSYSNSSAPITTFNVCVGTPPPPPTCGQVFYDNGGPSGVYLPNSNQTIVICPTTPGDMVRLIFTQFSLENNYDRLMIYDGNSAAAPLLGNFTGNALPPLLMASNPTGCLTAVFTSDGSGQYDGWVAQVTCSPLPVGDCVYVLDLRDSGGNGWGSSSVRVRINGGGWTSYTVTAFSNFVLIGVNIGNLVEIEYVATGPNQNQNSYSISKLGQNPYFSSATPPAPGISYSQIVTCGPPPAQPQDCIGGITVCSSQAITNTSASTGDVPDLNSTNQGCLSSGERQGTWYYFSPQTNGTIAFAIAPANGSDDYDFAVWGPYASAQCPTGPPLRCSYDAPGPYTTGLNATATLTTEGAGGTGWVKNIAALAGQVYVLYIDNFSSTGQAFTLSWQLSGGTTLDCTTLPVEFLSLEATARKPVIDVSWATATEQNSSHYIVERSSDNETFTAIGTMQAAGNSQSRIDYLFVDEAPHKGVNYYRLQQVDLDGNTEQTHTVTATLFADGGKPTLYPNPATDMLNVAFNSPLDGSAVLLVEDALGRTIAQSSTVALRGEQTAEVPLAGLATGWYNLRIALPDGSLLQGGVFLKQ